MAGPLTAYIDERIAILEAEIWRGFLVAAVLGAVALALLGIACFGQANGGSSVLGIPAALFDRLIPGGCGCFSAAGTFVPLKLITPVRERISTLRMAKNLPEEALKEMVLKAVENAMQPGGIPK